MATFEILRQEEILNFHSNVLITGANIDTHSLSWTGFRVNYLLLLRTDLAVSGKSARLVGFGWNDRMMHGGGSILEPHLAP